MRATLTAIVLTAALTLPIAATAKPQDDSGPHVVCGKHVVTFAAFFQENRTTVPDSNRIQVFTVRRADIRTVKFSQEHIPWVEVGDHVYYISLASAADLGRCLHGKMDDEYQALEKRVHGLRRNLASVLKRNLELAEQVSLERKRLKVLAMAHKASLATRCGNSN